MEPTSLAIAYDHNSPAAVSPIETESLQKNDEICPQEKSVSGQTKKSCFTRGRLIRIAIAIAFILAVIIALVFALAPPGGPKEWFLHPAPPGLKAAQRWDNGGYGGLQLTVLNAVDNNYQTLFYEWVQRWDNGTPDALTLTTQQTSYDFDCTPVDGVLKVCNGNYGNTGWRGIDFSTISNGYIVNSVAKMNDYYLTSEGQTWKEYTM
jgi:hypothetical protein